MRLCLTEDEVVRSFLIMGSKEEKGCVAFLAKKFQRSLVFKWAQNVLLSEKYVRRNVEKFSTTHRSLTPCDTLGQRKPQKAPLSGSNKLQGPNLVTNYINECTRDVTVVLVPSAHL